MRIEPSKMYIETTNNIGAEPIDGNRFVKACAIHKMLLLLGNTMRHGSCGLPNSRQQKRTSKFIYDMERILYLLWNPVRL